MCRMSKIEINCPSLAASNENFDMDSASAVGSYTGSTIDPPLLQKPSTKKRTHSQMVSSETSDILREFLANRPKPSDFFPLRPMDDLQSFFDNMCDTVRKFPPIDIATIKFEIAQIVCKQEILWAENATKTMYIQHPKK